MLEILRAELDVTLALLGLTGLDQVPGALAGLGGLREASALRALSVINGEDTPS
ncbi:hypothetical protein [Azorhizobium sp. AG788]|uniref:hypothetical protein n=1 Tax=Azorhizobium sp. AG788 TaxID=2183897 RepID=UPI00313A2D91